MCLDYDTPSYSPPPRPAGAGFTVAEADTGTGKKTTVFEGGTDVTDKVELDGSTNKYVKKRTTNSAIDTYAGM